MKTQFIAILIFVCSSAIAQQWTQRADLAGSARWGATGFGIGTTGYICSGTNGTMNFVDLWAWDQVTDTWSERASFPGVARREGVAFSIDSIGYFGFGRMGVGQMGMNDLWAYHPTTDTWVQMASLPSVGRASPSAFVLNGKAYLIGGNPQAAPYLTQLWEYDPSTDSWTQHTSLPATGRSAPIAFAVNGKGYVGSGNDNSANYACKDFWQWDPVTDTWTQKGDVPGPERRTASYFPFDDLPIAGGGWDGTTYFTDYYVYNSVLDSWSPIPEFLGLGAHTPVSFNVNELGYVGTGGIPGGQTAQYWEFDKGGLNGISEGGPDQLSSIDILVQDRTITILNWTLNRADSYQLCDASGRTITQSRLRSDQIRLKDLGTGRYTLILSNGQGVRSSHIFTVLAD